MVLEVAVSTRLLAAIVADATFDAAAERCGLLFGHPGRIDLFQPVANVAASPADSFELDPATLLAAHKAARGGGPQIIGHYHCHPSGQAWPSLRDADASAADGQLWLIVGGGEARLFRSTRGGLIHGAFDHVPMRHGVTPSSPNGHGTVAQPH